MRPAPRIRSTLGTPTAEHQTRFVVNLQHLLTEGEFVNTYKFALLLSLARWAVENPDHDERQPLDVAALAPHFTELYWPHVQPFAASGPVASVAELRPTYGTRGGSHWDLVLRQDRGQRTEHQVPRVLKRIRDAQRAGGTQFHQLPGPQRERLLAEVRRSIAEMPLWRLHRVRDHDEPMRFLYRPGPSQQQILFEEGAVGCLARFAPLVEETVRAAWLRHVLACNTRLLGAVAAVETFLFPDSRADLLPWRQAVAAIQGDRCFYCDRTMRDTPAVDHFLPWTRYRRDLGHNFVLAHAECNHHKRDHLATPEHLERWCRRNEEHGADLAARFDAGGLPHDWPTLRRVAGSLYQLAEAHGAQLWRRQRELVAIDGSWKHILGVA